MPGLKSPGTICSAFVASCKAIEMLCGLRIKSTLGLLLDVPAEEPQLFGSIVATPTRDRACRFRTTTPRRCPDITLPRLRTPLPIPDIYGRCSRLPAATVDLPVDLPASNAAPHEKPDKPVYVTIQADLALALGEAPVKRADLVASLDALGGDKNKRIFLRADSGVPYGEMMSVAGGYLEISLVALDAGGAK